MARTPARTRVPTPKALITWTRFYLPRDQEWPVWAVGHDDVHAGPLADVGVRQLRLGRMVDNPEQAAYIIEWWELEDFRKFKSSPACIAFLSILPESKDAVAAVIESGSQLEQLILDDATASALSSPAKSRFLSTAPRPQNAN